MSNIRPFDHQRYRDLLAPFALDALDDEERLDVADHLLECDACTVDVDDLLDTTSVLALSETEPPPAALWDRITSGMNAPEVDLTIAPPAQDTVVRALRNEPEPLAPVINLADRRRVKPWIAAVAGAAAASALVIPITRSTLQPKAPSFNLAQMAAEQAKVPGTRRIDLISTDGNAQRMGDVIVTSDGKGYIRMDDAEQLPDDRTYQLWTVVDGKPVSAGLLGRKPSVAAFAISSNAVAVAVSVEKASGAPAPEIGAIAVATF